MGENHQITKDLPKRTYETVRCIFYYLIQNGLLSIILGGILMKSKVLMSLSAIAISACFVIGGTLAALSDYGTSNGNSFTAGTLDLKVDGYENYDAKMVYTNLKPDSQPVGSYTLKNAGSLVGYLNISNISRENIENGITPPEALAGDTTSEIGELGAVLNLRLYVDEDKDGYFSTGDYMIFNNKVDQLPTTFKLNKQIAPGQEVKINAVYDWWDTADDNKAQNDTLKVNFRFDLTQRIQP